MTKCTIAGTGYVGLSNAVLLAQHNQVVALDIVEQRVALLNQKVSPIVDTDIDHYLKEKQLNLVATTDKQLAYQDAEIVIIATPTNYDPITNAFDTQSIESVVQDVLSINPDALLVINQLFPWDTPCNFGARLPRITLFLRPNFYAKEKRYTTIFTLHAL